MSYNGWENYETWCVNLWLSNDEGLYEQTRDMAINYIPDEDDETGYNRDEAVDSLADEICLNVNALAPETGGLFRDLLTTALDRVNWQEIAHAWLDEAVEEAA